MEWYGAQMHESEEWRNGEGRNGEMRNEETADFSLGRSLDGGVDDGMEVAKIAGSSCTSYCYSGQVQS